MHEGDPDAPWPTHVPEHKPQSRPGFRERRRRRMQRTRKRAQQIANMLIQEGSKVVNDPDTARRYAHFAAQLPLAVARLALRWPDPPTLYKGPLGIEKRVAWSDPLPLVDIKMIGKTFEGTVNDVLLSIVTGALRRYLQDRGEMVEGADIRGVVPVNLRPIELDDELGNQFGLVFLDLPISTGDPLLRLIKLKKSMDNLKSTPEAVASYGILNVFGVLPLGLQRFGVSIFDTKGTAVMTNVPGPQEQLYFAGAPLRSVMAWVPQSGRLGLGVSILSYNGQVWLGLATDKGLVPDPERIIDFFTQKFQEMKSLAQRSKEKRSEPVEPMFTRLDRALDILDELLAESEQTNSGNGGPTPGRCRATTKSGRQCKNLPLTGEQYCRVHIP